MANNCSLNFNETKVNNNCGERKLLATKKEEKYVTISFKNFGEQLFLISFV